MSNLAMEKWTAKWADYDFASEYAAKRIKSAKTAKLTPVLINKDDCYAYFQGGHGRYETFLDYCPCGDSRGGKTPCKHIYRLAMELGVLDEDFKTDANAVPVSREEKVSVDDTVSLIESLPKEAQELLLKIASSVSSKKPTIKVTVSDSGADYIRSMSASGIITLDGEVLKKRGIEMTVAIPTRYSSRTIHYYLHRKYGDDIRMGENGEWIRTPMLQTILPDDKITEQLIKYGYY